jgi:hypothetical protein
LDSPNAKLVDDGTLTVAGGVAITAGKFDLQAGGFLQAASLEVTGGGVVETDDVLVRLDKAPNRRRGKSAVHSGKVPVLR